MMFLFAYILVILLSVEVRVHSKAISEEDGLSIADLKNAKANDVRREQVRRELSSDDDDVAKEDSPPQGATAKGSEEVQELSRKITTDRGPSDLKKAMEKEGGEPNQKGAMNKSKREICDRILEQLRYLPCDNPVVITCGGENRMYPCTGDHSEISPLRAAQSDVDNILGAAEVVPQPTMTQPALVPPVELPPAHISPVQTIPISSPSMAANLLPGVSGILSQDVLPIRPLIPPMRILTAEERRERQKGIFEGLLRFGTVVNHIDSFLTDKSKMIIRGLHRMVQSEEDSRFS